MRIMIVGEAPSERDDYEKSRTGVDSFFVGQSGELLNELLAAVGVDRSDVFTSNVTRVRPPNDDIKEFFFDSKCTQPKHEIVEGITLLGQEIRNYNPDVILALGNTSLWALTGNRSVSKWRGSQLETTTCQHVELGKTYKVVPTYHPAAVLRQYTWRKDALHDFGRAIAWAKGERQKRKQNFLTNPSFNEVLFCLDTLLARAQEQKLLLSCDIETRFGHIACFGLAWSRDEAICIPLISRYGHYWGGGEEPAIIQAICRLINHPNVFLIGQNYSYDTQYTAKWWGLKGKLWMDTMVAHGLCFPGTQRGLDYLASLYAEHYVYWKDEGKLFDLETMDENRLWYYNCLDAAYTYEVALELDKLITAFSLRGQHNFMLRQFDMVLSMMLRGVRRDDALQSELLLDCLLEVGKRQELSTKLLGHYVNPRSPKQLQNLFYHDLKQPVINSRKGKRNATTDEDALFLIAKREPLLSRLCYAITEQRALSSAISVISKKVDTDKRIRCSYDLVGTVTFRYSSYENAFGTGTNLQNITSGRTSAETGLQIPNLRRLATPDVGKLFVDVDLQSADLLVVIWEANDESLKRAAREGLDLHLCNARDVFNLPYSIDNLRDPALLKRIKAKYHDERQFTKVFVHATNYGGKARTVARAVGLPVRETERHQKTWFAKHPGIEDWHRRTEHSLAESRSVSNKFGFRVIFFDHIETLLPEALAWVPQSTVALTIDSGAVNLHENRKDVELLLQVHDSLDFQVDKNFTDWQGLQKELSIVIPYDDPLIIPVGFKVSDKSWGDCKDLESYGTTLSTLA